MAVSARVVTVATTATRLDTVSESDRSTSSFAFYNGSDATVYVGGSTVTTATGLPVPTLSWSPGFELEANEAMYGIVAAATKDVRVIETSV